MANQQAQNDGAFDVIIVIALEVEKAKDAVKYYHEVFGAEELKRRTEKKRKVDVDFALLQVLLQFGSIKILVDECFEEELTDVQNCAIQLVYEGNHPDTVFKKAVQNGGTAITSTSEYVEDELAFSKKTHTYSIVKDPFGIVWTIAGKRIVTETGSDNATSSGTAGSNDTTSAETGSNDTNAADTTGSNDTTAA